MLYIELFCGLFFSFTRCDRTESSSSRDHRRVFEKGAIRIEIECCNKVNIQRCPLVTSFGESAGVVAEKISDRYRRTK